MQIKSILVATDLSAREHRAVERALQIARAQRAALKLMYVPPVREAATPDAGRRLAALGRELEDALDRAVKTVPVRAHKLADLKVEARAADLLVLAHRHERSTAAFFRGQPVMQIVRECRCPVYVVRAARRMRSGRSLVVVDFTLASAARAAFAARLDPAAQLHLFHAIDRHDEAQLRKARPAAHELAAYRQHRMKYARERILELAAGLGAQRPPLVTVIGHGDPAREAILQQEHLGADLVVVGRRDSSAWEDFFRGSIAHRVLSWGSSDVLVVPDARVQPAASGQSRPRRGRSLFGLPAARSLS